MTHFSYMAEQPNERTNEENEASSLSPLQNCRLLLVARSVAWVMISPAFLPLRRGGPIYSNRLREQHSFSRNLSTIVLSKLSFLSTWAVRCRRRCLEFASEARAIFFLSLNPILPPSPPPPQHSLLLPPPLLLEPGRTEGKHTSGGN